MHPVRRVSSDETVSAPAITMDTDIGCAAAQKGPQTPILLGEPSDGLAQTEDEVSQLELMEENALLDKDGLANTEDEVSQLELMEENALFLKEGLARTNAEITEKELMQYKALLATSLEYLESYFDDWLPDLCTICHNGLSDHDNSFCPFMMVATQVRDKPAGQKTGDFPTDLSSAERCAADLMRQRKMNLVRISNHLKYEYEAKLELLFKRFGCVTHVSLDYEGGYGFVNFSDRIGALTAIRELNGYAFEDLSLRVEWATLSPERIE